MIQAKTGVVDLGGAAPQGQPKRAGDAGGEGGDDRFAQTLEGKRREMNGGPGSGRRADQANPGNGAKDGGKSEQGRSEEAQRADKGARDGGDGARKAEKEEGKRAERTDGAEKRSEDSQKGDGKTRAEEGEGKTSEQARAEKPRLELRTDGEEAAADAEGGEEEAARQASEAQRDLAAAEVRAKAEEAEEATDQDGKELPQEEQLVAGLVVAQAAKEGARKAQTEGVDGRDSVRQRVLEAVAETGRGKGHSGERGVGSEADRRFFQGLQERLGEQRAMQDGESLLKNASKQESERGLQGFLRTLQQASARDAAAANQGNQSQAGAVSPTAAPTGQSAPTPPPTLNLQTPVNQQGWDQALGERVAWMAKDGVQEARIQLHPRNMGPIEVRLSVNQDQASVHFTAQHGLTRDAIEQAMPRLREMLAEQGLNLADSEVADQGPQGREQTGEGMAGDGEGDGDRPDGLLAREGDDDGGTEEGQAGEAVIAPSGLDYYA